MSLGKPLSNKGSDFLIFIISLQKNICEALMKHENKNILITDPWEKGHNTGGGISCVIENGSTFEKAGVNISAISTFIIFSNALSIAEPSSTSGKS